VWGPLIVVSVIRRWLLIGRAVQCPSRRHFAAYKNGFLTANVVRNQPPLPWTVQLVTDQVGAPPLLRSPVAASFHLPIVVVVSL
jgi:hypothetical protein